MEALLGLQSRLARRALSSQFQPFFLLSDARKPAFSSRHTDVPLFNH